jgi:hypothetical protein
MTVNVKERTPVWMALAAFYLDTELQQQDFQHIRAVISASPYNLEEVKRINKYEIFPVLQVNLLSVAGEWAGFEEAWLVNLITDGIRKQNIFRRIYIDIYYYFFGWMCRAYWKKLHYE